MSKIRQDQYEDALTSTEHFLKRLYYTLDVKKNIAQIHDDAHHLILEIMDDENLEVKQ